MDHLRECEPHAGRFEGDRAEYDRRRRIPKYLLLAATTGA